ncbi:MAG: NADH-quinone oxidoreductase subunit F [Sulfobacillus acidophilus]|uniref:NADH-quinone oxidoreductase subunit F n=1 Tax=Sulfobacillus acidophilus TaxID=53633 RepID=A0A2T2WID6_9FIRM|nr:MAG: NADH-quinone oxidoreductase subunit F [Sulfobacillus acidophilus]
MVIGVLLAPAVLAVFTYRKKRVALASLLVFSIGILIYGALGLWHGTATTAWDDVVQLTALRSWFLIILGLVAAMSLWYSFGYHDLRQSVIFWLPLFLLSMTAVLLAANLWVFMTGWESMTITSFFLVTTHHERADVLKSSYIYLVMSQGSAMLILAGFMVIGAHLHSYQFSEWTHYAAGLTLSTKTLVFALLGLGFGIKSGVVPFHVWLPRAHPAAPAPVSSLMSGVMIKLGIFGIIQFLLLDLGASAHFWPLLILAAGAMSSLLGVLYALMEHDLKRLLAYHSIENMGIILLGLGVMSLGIDWHHPLWVAIGLIAALFHSLNHAIFKSQLFLAAGAVEQHSGTLDIDHLGGLIRTTPAIALGFIGGAMAISALPPFNGFVSEWLTFRGLIDLIGPGTGLLSLYGLGLVMVLGLTGALAALCFVKASGIVFLGEARHAVPHQPLPGTMVWPVLTLGALTLVLGVIPQPLLHLLQPIEPTHLVSSGPMLLPIGTRVIAGLLVIIVVLLARLSRIGDVRTVPRWSCGRQPNFAMQYTSASFTKSIRTTFALIYRPHRTVERLGPAAPDFPESLVYRAGTVPVWERYFYRPLYRLIWRVSHLSTRIQNGPVRLYLAYLLGTVGIMLAILH